MVSVQESYRIAADVARRAASSFYPSFRLLPSDKRAAMCAFYAFARITDDVADAPGDATRAASWLGDWREVIDGLPELGTLPGSLTGDFQDLRATQILPALRDAIERFQIDRKHLIGIIDGALLDQDEQTFATWQQVEEYCYLVASTVGLVCLQIWGSDGNDVTCAAVDCGKAFQLTNIVRDVREDASRGRCYLPTELFEELNVDSSVSLDRSAVWLPVLQHASERASDYFDSGWQVFDHLHPDGKRMFSMMWRSYRQLLANIEQDPASVLQRRVSLSLSQKARIAASHFVRPVFGCLGSPVESGRQA